MIERAFDRRQPEAGAHVHHGHHTPANLDEPGDVGGGARDPRGLLEGLQVEDLRGGEHVVRGTDSKRDV
jgi:hypothetical protein